MSKYETLTLVLQVIVGSAAFVTLWFLYRQLRLMQDQLLAMQETSNTQSVLALVNFLQAPEVRAARQCVRDVLSRKPLAEWSPQERQAASMVCANYDVVAGLLKARVAPPKLIVNNWGPSIRHCHAVLQPYIAELRCGAGGHPAYWSNFDWLRNEVDRGQP